MDQTLTLISNRREEVMKIIAEAEKALASARAELQALEVSGRTVAALTGAEWHPISQADATSSASSGSVFARDLAGYAGGVTEMDLEPKSPPASEMIMAVMRDNDALAGMMDGITPRDMRVEIKRRFGKDLRGEYVSTQMWRLADKEKLETVSKGHYRLKRS